MNNQQIVNDDNMSYDVTDGQDFLGFNDVD